MKQFAVMLTVTALLSVLACTRREPSAAQRGGVEPQREASSREYPTPEASRAHTDMPAGEVVLKDAKGKTVGAARLFAHADGVRITGEVHDLPHGPHGFHVHESGSCETPDFKSAGAHFNPAGKAHGDLSPLGPHAGDLPNLLIGHDGKAKFDVVAGGATLGGDEASLFKSGGTALVIHAKEDDRQSDPAGNAGDRIACGVIARK